MMKTGVCERAQCGFLVVEGRLWVLWSGGLSPHACDYGLARGGEAALLLSLALGDEPHLLEGLQLAQPIPCTKNWTKTLKGKMKTKFPIIRGISIFLSMTIFKIIPNKALQSKTVPS